MTVVIVKPGYAPYEAEINGLDEMQEVVGGMIQAIYPFEDRAAVVCNDEGIAVREYKIYKQAAGVVCSKRLLNQAVGKSLRTHNLKPKKGAQVMRKNEKITALYERLSRDDFGKDDDQQRESNSISNQKAMLEEFAARQGFTNIVHFTDDGISGTCFDEVR